MSGNSERGLRGRPRTKRIRELPYNEKILMETDLSFFSRSKAWLYFQGVGE